MLRTLMLLVMTCFCFNIVAKSSNKIFFYQPERVTLEGKLVLKTFPGPPNYESLKGGDDAETGWYLKLERKIDVLVNEKHRIPANVNDEDERAVDFIQLVLPNGRKEYDKYKKRKNFQAGASVKLSGSLFRRFTGHHHTRVLLQLED